MNDAMAGVLMMAIFIFGIVGGVIALTIIQKVIPLLEAMARAREQAPAPEELARLREEVAGLRDAQPRVAELEERVGWLYEVLETREPAGLLTGNRESGSAAENATGGAAVEQPFGWAPTTTAARGPARG